MPIEIPLQDHLRFNREAVQAHAARLAQRGVYVGTSSWKYPGWRGMLYDETRYRFRGRLAESRFERDCLREYGEVFKTVSVDAAYYRFPDRGFLEGLMAQTPSDFLFGFKVTDEITVKRFPNLSRFGERAGQINPHFLDAELFARAFLGPCEPFRERVGLLMFEFSRFYPADFERGRDFVEALDNFLEQLPKGWPYGVEIRNRHFLHRDYFATLARHQVAHVFNYWAAMPPAEEQMAMAGSRTHPRLRAARFLLAPGRSYAEAVKRFSPYTRALEVNTKARAAGAQLLREGIAPENRDCKTFLYVNNRLEGNALETIAAMLAEIEAPPGAPV